MIVPLVFLVHALLLTQPLFGSSSITNTTSHQHYSASQASQPVKYVQRVVLPFYLQPHSCLISLLFMHIVPHSEKEKPPNDCTPQCKA